MTKKILALVCVCVVLVIGLVAIVLTRPWTFPVVKEKKAGVLAEAYAPDFSLVSLEGTSFTLSQFRGKKAVVLDFWASWCPNCQRNMPTLDRISKKFQSDVQVLGINLSEQRALVQRFQQKNNLSFPLLLDDKEAVARLYDVAYTNTHILVSKDGKRLQTIRGDLTEKDIKTLIKD